MKIIEALQQGILITVDYFYIQNENLTRNKKIINFHKQEE